MWLLLRANTLSIGGWLQISSKGWFEKEFYSPKFVAFIAWTHKRVPQIIFMDVSGISLGYGVKSSTEKGYATSSARTYLSGGKEKSLQILGGSLYKLQQSGAFSLEHLYLQDDEAYTLVKERH